jgi:excisionase family DNA binding protein
MPPSGAARILGTAQIAKRLGVDRDSAARLCRTGNLPGAFRAGGRWKISAENLDLYIAERTPSKKS